MPTVSVVIPTYDRADVLPRAMDSALGQTVADLELVVVDDGSTDDTEAVVADYDDDRVRYVAHERNRGANVARNTGVEAADGEYVAFLDSDDEWKPTKLERQLDRLDGEDDWVAAYCGFERAATDPTARAESAVAGLLARADDDDRPTEGGEELAGEILAGHLHPGAGSTLVVETAVARSIGGFDESLDRFQDPDIVLRILREGPVAHVDAPLVVRHDTGAPAAETVAAADREYLEKHDEAVERAEDRGLDVRGTHDLLLAKSYLAEGAVGPGLRHLSGATVPARHVPGLAWAAVGGVRRRSGRGTAMAGALAFVALVGVLARRR